MAVGDVVSDIQSIASGSYLDIRPGAGAEWVIHNVYHEDAVQISFYDGVNEITFDLDTGAGSWRWEELHCNNTRRYRVKNNAGVAKLIGYDGIVTK